MKPLDPRPEITAQQAISPAFSVSPQLFDPFQQLRVLWRFRWQIVGMILLCMLVAVLVLSGIKPQYRATATLLIESRGAKIVKIQEVYEPEDTYGTDEYQNTQAQVLQSRLLAEQVFAELKLAETGEYQVRTEPLSTGIPALVEIEDALREIFPGLLGGAAAPATSGVDRLLEKLAVEQVPKTNLVKIHAQAQDPKLGASIANALVARYIQYDQESRGGITTQATDWLYQRLEQIRADLEKAEKNLQAFYDSEQLVNVGGTRGLIEDEISDNARRLREAQQTKTDLENVYRRVVAAGSSVEKLQEISSIQQDGLVRETKKKFLDAQQEVGSLGSRYGRNHPKMTAALERFSESREAFRRQVLVVADSIRSQYEIARNTESSVERIVQGSRAQIQGMDRKQAKLDNLQREVETNRKLYETFLERTKETDIAGNMDIGKVRVIESAAPPTEIFKPHRKLWLATAAMTGLFLGLLMALLRGALDDTVKTPAELENLLSLPVLTVLPLLNRLGRMGERLLHLELREPHNRFSEGIRTMRTSLLLADVEKRRSLILVTSAAPGEGKTSVALNFAQALGQSERVLLIDADLRKPTIASRLKLPSKQFGVTDFLTGKAPIEQCIVRDAEGNIDILPCGTLPPNPLELISSLKWANLLEYLAQNYDRVVLDSAPCQPVSDSLLLGRLADAVIFIVKADATRRGIVANSFRQLKQAGAPVIGAVLNQADTRRHSGFSYGYDYYKGGYGSYTASS